MKKKSSKFLFVQVIERDRRKLILKRGKKATEYFEYCGEVGCDFWEELEGIKEALFEPAGFWLSANLIKPGTSEYVQGVEVPFDFVGEVPAGCDLIELEPQKYMIFQGEPYDDADFEAEVAEAMTAIGKFQPEVYGYKRCDDAPRFQLSPQGYRGYIEARPVKEMKSYK